MFRQFIPCVLLAVAGLFEISADASPNAATLPAAPARLLWVSETGDDATAVAGMRSHPWKTVYDIRDSSRPSRYGAAAAARPGDWIVFEKGTYRVPSVPLNLPAGKGLNLLVPAGATLIRRDFSNTNGSPLPANLGTCGPLILPGNGSHVQVDGLVIATNADTYDAVVGWADYLSIYYPRSGAQYGFTNWPADRVLVDGQGTLQGKSDVIYMTTAWSPSLVNATFRNLHLRSRWDCGFLTGKCKVSTEALDICADATLQFFGSHGIVAFSGAQWTDKRSVIAATGCDMPGDSNAAAYVLDATNRFDGTTLIAYGVTNVLPYISRGSSSSGWYYGYGSGTNHLGKVTIK